MIHVLVFQMAFQRSSPKLNRRMTPYINKHVGYHSSLFAWEQSNGEIQIKAPRDTVGVYTTFVTPQGKFVNKMVMGERIMRTYFQGWTGRKRPTYFEERALQSLPQGSVPPPMPTSVAPQLKRPNFPENPKFPDLNRYKGLFPQDLMEMGNKITVTAEVHPPPKRETRVGSTPDSPILVEDEFPFLCDTPANPNNNWAESCSIEDQESPEEDEWATPYPPPCRKEPKSTPAPSSQQDPTPAKTLPINKQVELLESILNKLNTKRGGKVIFSSLSTDTSTVEPASTPEEDLIQLEDTDTEEEQGRQQTRSSKKKPCAKVSPIRRAPTPGPTEEDRLLAQSTESAYESESPSYTPPSYSPIYSPGSPVYTPSSPDREPPFHIPLRAPSPLRDPWEEEQTSL